MMISLRTSGEPFTVTYTVDVRLIEYWSSLSKNLHCERLKILASLVGYSIEMKSQAILLSIIVTSHNHYI